MNRMTQVGIQITLDVCTPEGKTWLARITGPDQRYGLAREFVRPVSRDISRSGMTGSMTYVVTEPGVYERHEGRRRLRDNNGCFRVTSEGAVVPLDRDELFS